MARRGQRRTRRRSLNERLFVCPACFAAVIPNDSRKINHEFYNMQAPPMEEVVDIQNPRKCVAFRECDLRDDLPKSSQLGRFWQIITDHIAGKFRFERLTCRRIFCREMAEPAFVALLREALVAEYIARSK